MPSSEPQDPTNENDVLTNLPRSRRQRPSVRREAARISQASAKTRAKVAATGIIGEATHEPKAKHSALAEKTEASGLSRVPRAGYATPSQGKSFGNADPAGLLTELTRAVLRLLPG